MGLPGGAESDVQGACLDWLRLWGAVAIRVNSGAMKIDERFVGFNDQPGCSDVLVCLPGSGRFLALEAKKPGRDRTAAKRKLEQESFRAAVVKTGGLALVVRSLDELKTALRAEGYDTERQGG